jgi:gamma-glutamylcyclotransferase (GGCT)/AIG2-like uncharacterized protein YtfP
VYYFAYGTLASGGLMAKKCPGARFLSRAELRGYRMEGLNIVPADDSSVDGVLWEIDEECLRALDVYENYPDWYSRKGVDVYAESTGEVEAVAYFIPLEG